MQNFVKKLFSVTLLSIALAMVACSPKAKKAEDKPANAQGAMGVPAASAARPLPAAPTAMAASAAAKPVTAAPPAAMGTPPTALSANRVVKTADPKGKALSLIERKCTQLGSYKLLSGHLNRYSEPVCYNPNTAKMHRMCFSGFPTIGRVVTDITTIGRVFTFNVKPYFHKEMVVSGHKTVTADLVCYLVPQDQLGKAPRVRTYRRAPRGMSSGSGGNGSYRGTSGTTTVTSTDPTSHDRVQDRKIADLQEVQKDHGKRLTKAEQRLDKNDTRWEKRDKWADAANTLLSSLKK